MLNVETRASNEAVDPLSTHIIRVDDTLPHGLVTVPGTSLEESNAIGRRVEQILLANPAVKNTDRRQGRAELDEHAQGVNAAEIDVTLKEEVEKEALFEQLRREFSAIPGTNVTIGQPSGTGSITCYQEPVPTSR